MNEPWKRYQSGEPWKKYGNTQHDILPMDEKVDYGLGVVKGGADVIFNIGRAGEALNTEKGQDFYNKAFMNRFGYAPSQGTSLKESEEKFNQYMDDKRKQGVVPSGVTEAVSEMALTAPAFMLGPLAGGAIASGFTTEQRDPLGVATDMALGGAFGKAGDASMAYLSNKSRPILDNSIEKLKQMRVIPTFGEKTGGLVKNIEDKLTSVPGVGNMIDRRRSEGMNHWREGVFNEVLAPIGAKLPANLDDMGHSAFTYMKNKIGTEYERLLPAAKFKWDQPMIDGLTTVKKNSESFIPRNKKRIDDIFQQRILPRLGQGGEMAGRQFKELDSFFSSELRKGKNATSLDDREYLDAIAEIQSVLKETFRRSNAGTDIGRRYDAVQLAYAKRSILKRAVEKNNSDGSFTPQNLMSAVRQEAGGDQFARGSGLLQQAAIAGKRLGSTTPDSGTAGRYIVGAGLLGAGSGEAYANGDIPYGTAAALAIPSLLYTRTGQNALKGMFGRSRQKQKIFESMRKPVGLLAATNGPNLLLNP